MRNPSLILLPFIATGAQAFVPTPPCRSAPTSIANDAVAVIRRQPPDSTNKGGAISTTSLNFFSLGKKEAVLEPYFEPVIIDPDFRVALLFLAIGGVLDLIPYIQLTLGPLVTLLGLLFLVQTFRLRFIFDKTAFELATVQSLDGKEIGSPGENIVVGGANRWDTKTIFNYDFFPSGWIDGPIGPILVYFKEDQTSESMWNDGPGKLANDPEKIKAGIARPGQVHFFPAVANAAQLREEFGKRGCKKI